jgi:thiamine-phosphate pyrophosphorylase
VSAPILILITDPERLAPTEIAARFSRVANAAKPGSIAFQLRHPGAPARPLLELGRALLSIAEETGQTLWVNDRIDVALALGVHGLHLGEESVATSDARRLMPIAFVSRACHDPAEVSRLDADAVILSPILEPRKGRPALGLEALRSVRQALAKRPAAPLLLALGGIDAERAPACIEAGADGVCVMGAVHGEADPLSLVRALGIQRR